MFVLAGFGCLYAYLGSGPLWPEAIKAADVCKVNWWTNMLYVNNLVRVDDMVNTKTVGHFHNGGCRVV